MARGLARTVFNGQALREIRTANERMRPAMSAEALAGRIGATKAQILAYEQGTAFPDPPRIRQLAAALRVHPLRLSLGVQSFGDLSDLRRACGFRIEDVVESLHISPKALRRFESEGIPPLRRPGLIDELADLLDVSHEDIVSVVDASSAVAERVRSLNNLIRLMRHRYVTSEEQWEAPGPQDEGVRRIAALTGRPVNLVTKVMTMALRDERQWQANIALESVRESLHPDASQRGRATGKRVRYEQARSKQISELAADLENFFRTLLPPDVWRTLHFIYASGNARWRILEAEDLPTRSVPQWTVHRFLLGDRQQMLYLTELGERHASRFSYWYRVLYPQIRVPEEQALSVRNVRNHLALTMEPEKSDARSQRNLRLPQQPANSAVAPFAQALRELWVAAQAPRLSDLTRRTAFLPATLLGTLEGRVFPDLPTTLALVDICGGDKAEWRQKWTQTQEQILTPTRP